MIVFKTVTVFQYIFIDELAHAIAGIFDEVVRHLMVGVERERAEPVDDDSVEFWQFGKQLVGQRAVKAVNGAVRFGNDLFAGIAAFIEKE